MLFGKIPTSKKIRCIFSVASTYLLRLSRTVFLKPTLARVATASTKTHGD